MMKFKIENQLSKISRSLYDTGAYITLDDKGMLYLDGHFTVKELKAIVTEVECYNLEKETYRTN